jgi:hypothetical protein
MTVFALPRPRAGYTGELYWRYIAIPLVGALRYGPSLLLALAAAYASAQWAQHNTVFPAPLAWLIGVAFEWLYLGSLAMSSALRSSRYFKPVNFGGMLVSILYGTLYAADKYGMLAPLIQAEPAVLWLFAVLHAAPLAGMNLLYNSLIHEYHAEQRADAEAIAVAEAEKVNCRYCGQECRNKAAEYSHYRTCPKHPKNQP